MAAIQPQPPLGAPVAGLSLAEALEMRAKAGKPVRVGFRVEKDGSKVRVARHGGKELKVLGVVHGPRGKA